MSTVKSHPEHKTYLLLRSVRSEHTRHHSGDRNQFLKLHPRDRRAPESDGRHWHKGHSRAADIQEQPSFLKKIELFNQKATYIARRLGGAVPR